MRILLSALAAFTLSADLGPAFAQTDPAPVEAMPVPADTPPDHASPSVCIVILGRLDQEASDGRAKADRAKLQAAARTFREKALPLYENDEAQVDQMVGSSVSFYDELTVPQLETAADMCLAAADETFTADE